MDLVFYNRLLQCYVLIDLKIDKLTHQDLGQMMMYVNYYDRYVKQEFEKPTVGILLCGKKNNAVVELTLPKDSNIYAAQYELYLPDKNELQEWYKTVTKCTLREVKSARDAIKDREDNILNYFIKRSTNASAESLNSKLKSFRAQVRGVSDLPESARYTGNQTHAFAGVPLFPSFSSSMAAIFSG